MTCKRQFQREKSKRYVIWRYFEGTSLFNVLAYKHNAQNISTFEAKCSNIKSFEVKSLFCEGKETAWASSQNTFAFQDPPYFDVCHWLISRSNLSDLETPHKHTYVAILFSAFRTIWRILCRLCFSIHS